jgi:hypothetical protein
VHFLSLSPCLSLSLSLSFKGHYNEVVHFLAQIKSNQIKSEQSWIVRTGIGIGVSE